MCRIVRSGGCDLMKGRWESSSFYLPPCGARALHGVMAICPCGAISLWGEFIVDGSAGGLGSSVAMVCFAWWPVLNDYQACVVERLLCFRYVRAMVV